MTSKESLNSNKQFEPKPFQIYVQSMCLSTQSESESVGQIATSNNDKNLEVISSTNNNFLELSSNSKMSCSNLGINELDQITHRLNVEEIKVSKIS